MFWRYKRFNVSKRYIMRRVLFSVLLAGLTWPVSAQADPTLHGSFGDWSVYSRYQGSAKTCFIYSEAKTKTPSNVRHGDIHFLDSLDERNLVQQMRAGSTMKVKAVSSRGTNVNYSFSLRGISAALEKAASACQ